MVKHDITAIPIIDPQTRKPLYVLSLMHIVDYLLHTFKQEDFSSSVWSRIQNILSPKSETFQGTPILSVERTKGYFIRHLSFITEYITLNLDPAPCVLEDCKLADAIRIMLESGAHRILVTDINGNLVNLITQSRIVELISLLVGSIPKCAKPIDGLSGLGTKQVIMMNERQTAYEAFVIMRDMKVSALPIVNGEGVLVGIISLSDIKVRNFYMLE